MKKNSLLVRTTKNTTKFVTVFDTNAIDFVKQNFFSKKKNFFFWGPCTWDWLVLSTCMRFLAMTVPCASVGPTPSSTDSLCCTSTKRNKLNRIPKPKYKNYITPQLCQISKLQKKTACPISLNFEFKNVTNCIFWVGKHFHKFAYRQGLGAPIPAASHPPSSARPLQA